MLAKIAPSEHSKHIEIQTNDDGSISICELRKQFPNSVGLRYRCKSSGILRGTRVFNDQLHLPLGVSWKDYVFHCVYDSNLDDLDKAYTDRDSTGNSRDDKYYLETFDIIALGLPDDMTDESFCQYFSKFGELKLCELKGNGGRYGKNNKNQKRYGFLQYFHVKDQNECMRTRHILRDCEVCLRLPTAKIDSSSGRKKLFVTNITPSVTMDDILEYFSVYGKITQIFMPPVTSPYAFLTFESEDSIARIFRFGESHRVFGGYVVVEPVSIKQEMKNDKTEISDSDNPQKYNSVEQHNNQVYLHDKESKFYEESHSQHFADQSYNCEEHQIHLDQQMYQNLPQNDHSSSSENSHSAKSQTSLISFPDNNLEVNNQMKVASELAAQILAQATAPNEKEVLVQLLVEELTSENTSIGTPNLSETETINTNKMIKAIRLLQNPKILDSLLQYSETVNPEFQSRNRDSFNSYLDKNHHSESEY